MLVNGVTDVGTATVPRHLPMETRTLVNIGSINDTGVDVTNGMMDGYMTGKLSNMVENSAVAFVRGKLTNFINIWIAACFVKINAMVMVTLYGRMVPLMKGTWMSCHRSIQMEISTSS